MKKTLTLQIVLLMLAQILCAETLYIVNSNSESLSKYDTDSGEVINNFLNVGQYANQIYINDGTAYVVNSGEHNIQVIDLETETTSGFIQCPNGSNPYWMVIIPNNEKGYVSGLFTNMVYVFDPLTNEITNSISVGNGPEGVYYYENRVYVLNTCYGSDNGTISVIDTETDMVVETITVANNPQFAAVDDQARLHAVCTGNYSNISGEVHIIDLQDYENISTIAIGGTPTRICIHPNGTSYLADGMGQGFMAYNIEDLSIIHPSDNLFATGGSFINYDSDEKIYLGDALDWVNNGQIHIYSADEEFIVDFTVGVAPVDAAFYTENSTGGAMQPQHSNHAYSYPNPFANSTQIRFSENAYPDKLLNFGIYNVRGERVKTFNIQNSALNNNYWVWDGQDSQGKNCSAGVYFYKIEFEIQGNLIGKMVKLR